MPVPRFCPFLPAARTLIIAAAMLRASAGEPIPAVSLVAGNGLSGHRGDNHPAITGQLNEPFGLVRGPDRCLWFCEFSGNYVRKISPEGLLSTHVGTGKAAYAGDNGPALAASLNQPHEIRFDQDGNLFIADTFNHVIRRVDAVTGIITTFAGTGKPGYSGDGGPAAQASFREPISLQFNSHGDLFICDIGNNVIRKIDFATRQISTFAGTGHPGPTLDGAPIDGTPLRGPRSIDFDAKDDLWLVTREGNQLFRLETARGIFHLVAGTGSSGFSAKGVPALQASFAGPKGIAAAPNGDIYLADTENHSIRRFNARTQTIDLVLGTGQKGQGSLPDPSKCQLARPHGIFVDRDGTVFVSDGENHRILALHGTVPGSK
jgi:streptogramin lyase